MLLVQSYYWTAGLNITIKLNKFVGSVDSFGSHLSQSRLRFYAQKPEKLIKLAFRPELE